MVLASRDPGPSGREPLVPGGDPPLPADLTLAAERDRIREALLVLCFENHYKELDLAVLLQRAAVSEAEFHRHYADLEDCFCQVYLEIRKDFLTRLSDALLGQVTWRDRIRAAAYFMLRFFAEDKRVTNFGIVEVRTAGERAQILFGGVFDALFDLLDQGRDERRNPSSRSRATAEAVGGGIFAQIYAAIEAGTPLSEKEVPKLMYAAVLPYLGVEAASEELEIPAPPPIVPRRSSGPGRNLDHKQPLGKGSKRCQ